ncbi:HAMP domain-containing sensor histidine kinase [Pseudonocardia sp. NPDC049635]|uniref:sensor histidine kinase n=1 Tax=Pseudonocardia sp. NPDC049635 TaxID=3155506 RepID=UPI0034038547
MRRRLLLALSLCCLLTVAAFVAPLLDERATARAQTLEMSRAHDLDRFVALAAVNADLEYELCAELQRSVHRHAELYGEGVLVVDELGTPLVWSGLEPDDPGVPAALDAALRNEPPAVPDRITPFDAEPILAWKPVGVGSRAEGAVLLQIDPSRAAADVTAAWSLVLAGALAAAVAFVGIALAVARWVLRPVDALAEGVGAVAQGRAGEQIAVSEGPAELRALTESFNRMSAAVRAGAEEQRRLVADASHQIRNPLAALRLRVDGLEPHVDEIGRSAYDSAQQEVDRLERLLDGMLGLASAEATASAVAAGSDEVARCDAGEVAARRVDAWRPVADAAGVALLGDGTPGLFTGWPDTDLEQVLDVLIDNAIRHTGSGTTVRVRWTSDATTVTVTVADDGPGLADGDLERARQRFWQARSAGGSGLGLAIADRLVAGRGGVLTLGRSAAGGLLATVALERL